MAKEDLVIKQWPQGKHWYAQIGNVDVKDKEGNMKWNTYKGAKDASHEFIIKVFGKYI